MFSYYELGFRCFELNLFSHYFDSARSEKFKPEQALRTLDWKDSSLRTGSQQGRKKIRRVSEWESERRDSASEASGMRGSL